jgi:type IV pilus assembly protein PilB
MKNENLKMDVSVQNLEIRKIDYRVSSFPGYYGEKIVIRILDSIKGVKLLNDLGFSTLQMKQIRAALGAPYGMVLISGPTGSGKTTTLYSMLNEIDRDHKNVVSLEDPVEYNVGGMNQSQVFPDIGYTFASGLRSILRQDPDVIMVGEIRDGETAQLAIQAALTGHLVFSTIHTNTSIGVVSLVFWIWVSSRTLLLQFLLLHSVNVLSRRIADDCGEAYGNDTFT